MKISGFQGEYRFLSNFWPADITILGIPYKSVEAAYQASKSSDIHVREQFSNLEPREARLRGRKLKLGPNWDDITKTTNMELCLRAKFLIPELRARLIATNDLKLEETNNWGDVFWGVCRGKGQNVMGKLLMILRDELIAYAPGPMYTGLDTNDDIPF